MLAWKEHKLGGSARSGPTSSPSCWRRNCLSSRLLKGGEFCIALDGRAECWIWWAALQTRQWPFWKAEEGGQLSGKSVLRGLRLRMLWNPAEHPLIYRTCSSTPCGHKEEGELTNCKEFWCPFQFPSLTPINPLEAEIIIPHIVSHTPSD